MKEIISLRERRIADEMDTRKKKKQKRKERAKTILRWEKVWVSRIKKSQR